MSLIDCQPRSPYRPPDWRWRKAEGIRRGLLLGTRRPDPWVRRAVRLQDRLGTLEWEGVPSRADRGQLGAYQIRHARDPRLRRELEARVLAGQSGQAIAERCGLPTDVVEAYERLFFDVRDLLGAPDYIAAVVIGTSPVDGFPASDVDAILKGFAYRSGPHVLDALLDVLDLGTSGEIRMTVAPTEESPLTRSIRMAILARSIPATEQNATGLIRLHARLMEVEHEAASDVALAAPIRATIEPFSAEVPCGQDGVMTPPASDLAIWSWIGPDFDRCVPRRQAVIPVPFSETGLPLRDPVSRRTA